MRSGKRSGGELAAEFVDRTGLVTHDSTDGAFASEAFVLYRFLAKRNASLLHCLYKAIKFHAEVIYDDFVADDVVK